MKVNKTQFWREQYKNENLIKEWYKNYISFYPAPPPAKIIKFQFLKGELKQIEEIFKNKKEQKEIFDFLKNIVLNIKEN